MSRRTLVRAPLAATASWRTVSRRTFIQGSAVALAALTAPALPTSAAGEGALVRYVNAAAGAPDLDLFSMDGTPVAGGLAFGKATKPARQPGGTFRLVVQPAGGEQSRPLLRKTLTLNDGARYVVAVFGEYPNLTVEAFDILVEPLQPGTSRLRCLHLARDLVTVDLGVTDGPTIAIEIFYGAPTPYTDVDAGTVDLEIRPTGASDVVLRREDTELEGGRVYDLLLFGRVTDDSLRTLLLTATAESASDTAGEPTPDAVDRNYLNSFRQSVFLLDQTLVNLAELLLVVDTDPDAALNSLAFVFIGWVTVYQDVEAALPPPRYEELRASYLAALEPLATTARQMSNVDDYLSGAATTFSYTALDINLIVQTLGNVQPQLDAASANLDAALREAGLPVD